MESTILAIIILLSLIPISLVVFKILDFIQNYKWMKSELEKVLRKREIGRRCYEKRTLKIKEMRNSMESLDNQFREWDTNSKEKKKE